MTTNAPASRGEVSFPAWLTTASLVGVGAGVVLGVVGNRVGWGPAYVLADLLGPVGTAWLLALQATVVPLVVVQLAAAVLGTATGGGIGRLTARTLAFFVAMMAGAGVVTAVGTPFLLALYEPPAAAVEGVRSGLAAILPPAADGAFDGFSWRAFVPTVEGIVSGRQLLPLLLMSGAAAFGLRALPEGPRARAAAAVKEGSTFLLRIVRLVLYVTPVGVFVIVLGMALELGADAAGVAVAFIVVSCVALLVANALLVLVTLALSRCPPRLFLRALAPGLVVGLSTRSSWSALPALVEEADATLELPPEGTGVVLPLAAALYKVGRPVQTTVELLFLAHVFGTPLGPLDVAAFIGTMLLLNIGSVGIPSGATSGMRGYPAFMAAGVPADGYFFVQVLGAIPDIFETALNVTAYLGSAVVLTWRRGIGSARRVA